jgi:hypothetical protein
MKPTEHKPRDSIDYYYANIPNPVDFRKTLLEASRDSVLILKQYEVFKKLRRSKQTEYEALKKLIEEITALMTRLKKSLPQTKMRETIPRDYHHKKDAQHPKQKSPSKPKAKPTQHTASKQPKNEFDRLEDELNVLEERINNLD